MKKVLLFLILLFTPIIAFAKDINIYLFYGEGCPHCAAEKEFLSSYLDDSVHLHKYELWYNEDNRELYAGVQEILGEESSSIPYLVIGNNSIVGFAEGSTEQVIKDTLTYYKNNNYVDKVGIYLGVVEETNETEDSKKETTIEDLALSQRLKNLVKSSSLLISTIVIGFVDGINPCAMWILLFLISMLIGISDKKRKWILGIVFLLSSAAVYFLFLISWLSLATFLNNIVYIRLAIAIVSVVLGTVQVINFLKHFSSPDGCEVVNIKQRRKIITSIKKIVKEKSFILAILGIILLAAGVNIIELMCSLGLPVVFTQLLVINNVTGSAKILYALVYIFFFLVDDIIVFVIAMKTLEIKAVSNKIGKYSHLIGGFIMLIIGILMIYKPEILMFNFK